MINQNYLDDNNILAEQISGSEDDQTIWYAYGGDGTLAGFTYNGAEYYYQKNLQDDIIGIYNTAGELVVTYEYDAWGNMTDMQDSSGCNLGEINPFRYRGYYYDEDTGWYYLQSRYYDPEVGRFLNADDVHYLGDETLSCNLFTYCMNNPVNYSDFNGYLTVNQIISKVMNFASYVISWLSLTGKVKSKVILLVSGISIGSGIIQYGRDWQKYHKKNKTQLRISTFSFALCLIGNVITIALAIYSLNKCKSAIKAFLWFIGTSLSMSLAAYAWVYDLAFASKHSYSWLKKQVRRRI